MNTAADMKNLKHSLFFLAFLCAGKAWSAELLALDAFLKEVSEQNLSIKSDTASLDAAKARDSGFDIPPPMVSVSQMRDQSGSANGFEINQTIPFPTKLSNNRAARKIEANAGEANHQAIKKEVLANARLAYVQLWLSQERVERLKEKKNAIQQHLKLSTATARSDSSIRIHTLKAESDLDLLENEIIEAEQMRRERQIQVAEYLQRNPVEYLPLVQEPSMVELPKKDELASPFQLEIKRLSFEKFKAIESEAKSSWLPDFNLRYRESGGTAMNPRYNETMLGVTLPFVFFWEAKATSNSASAERLKSEAEFNLQKVKIESRKAILLSKAESLRKQLEQINSKTLPRAEKRMKLVHNLAPRDMESLQDHRDSMESFPDLKLKVLDLRLQYEEVVTELMTYTSESSK